MEMSTLGYFDLRNTIVHLECFYTHAFMVYCARGAVTG